MNCELCEQCLNCRFTDEHMAECGILYTEALAATVMHHERDRHPVLNTDIAVRGNELQVKRVFREIVDPQVNEAAVQILDDWLMNRGKLDVDTLGEIPRLWRNEK